MGFLRRAQRDSYLISRTLGDVRAVKRGTLPKRLAKRSYHRSAIRTLRKVGLW